MKGAAMDINLHGATIALPAHGVTTLEDARGVRLMAVAGSFWVTQDGDRRDYFLAAGEDLDITTDGAVVIEAQTESRLAVLRPPAVDLAFGRGAAGPKGWRRLAALVADWVGPGRIDRAAPAMFRLRGL
jgi:hypothetical protein